MATDTPTSLPVKTRDVHNHHQDSTRWDDFPFREDDIIVTTYAKSGTTWMQQIMSQLIFKGDGSVSPALLSPWVDLRVVPKDVTLGMLEAQTNRRFMKSHLPADALVWKPDVKYIFVGRDGRDMIWSCYNHFKSATPAFWAMINDTPGRVGPPVAHPPDDPRDLFLDLLEDDSRTTIPWPYWSFIRSWWAVRNQPNVLFAHFADMKKDLDGEMRRIANFLGVPELTDEQWKAAVEHSTFDWMKKNASVVTPPQVDDVFENGAQSFINKGTNGRWVDVLTDEDNKRYLEKSREELGEECADWLEKGGLAQEQGK